MPAYAYDWHPDQAPPDDRIRTHWHSMRPCPNCGGVLVANGRDVDTCNNPTCDFGRRKRAWHKPGATKEE